MQLKILNVISENDYYIVKLSNDKYLRLGVNELSYLVSKLECDSSLEILFDSNITEISDNIKKIIDDKIEEYSNSQNSRFEGGLSMIKLVTVNPDKFLNRTYKYYKIFFSVPSVIIYVLLNIFTFYLMGQEKNNERIIADLSSLKINISTIIIVYMALVITLILHEIGHATVCKKYGGKVTKMGIVLFFLLPAMYCDVSDIYVVKNKKRKLYVSVAGLYVNSFWATVSILMYFLFHTSDTVANFLLFYFIANVGFIMYNLIPFVKLDGYWLLASILDINNLYVKSIICALTSIFDSKSVKNMKVSSKKKNIMIIYGYCAIIFRPVFWSFTLITIKQEFGNGLYHSSVSIAIDLMAFIVIIDLLKFYKEIYKKYHTQRSNIIGFL